MSGASAMFRRVAEARRRGTGVMACLVIHARGSTPQPAGALMFVDEAGNSQGTIGGGCIEAEARRRALTLLARGESALVRLTLDHDYGWDDGLICGGAVELAIAPAPASEDLDAAADAIEARRAACLALTVTGEGGPEAFTLRLAAPDRLYIAGAGHLGQAVARLAVALEFDATVFDDRADLLERAIAPPARGRAGSIAQSLADAPIDAETYCVIVTRGHRHDEAALAAVIGRGARYVGMIGSRRKIKVIFEDLAARGVRPEDLAHVHAPVGLPIGAVSAEEIAVAIAAQLVQVRRAGPGRGDLRRTVTRAQAPASVALAPVPT